MLPDSININNKYDLSAYLYVDRFFYGIFYNDKVVHKDSFNYRDQLDLSRRLKRTELEMLKLEKISVVSHIPPAGLIDYDNFSHDDFKSYFSDKYPGELLKLVNYYSNKLVGQKLFSTFALNQGLAKIINKSFDNAQYFHVTKVLSDYLVKKKSDSVLMLLTRSDMCVVSVEDGITSFSNTFRIKGELDPVYYVKSLYEALKYEPTKPIYIIDSDADQDMIKTFESHFPNSTVIPTSNLELIEALECVS